MKTPSQLADEMVERLWDVIPHDSLYAMQRRARVAGYKAAEKRLTTELPTELDGSEDKAEEALARALSAVAAKLGY